jgi:hypothetical protein
MSIFTLDNYFNGKMVEAKFEKTTEGTHWLIIATIADYVGSESLYSIAIKELAKITVKLKHIKDVKEIFLVK